jgi:hypothetical protein
MPKRHWWLLATTAIFAAGAANAQTPAPDLDKVERMQRQMEQLQEQMKQVKSDLVEAKKKAAEAKAEIPPAFNGAYGADLRPFPAKAPSIIDRVKLTWGGFLAAETVYRQHNAAADLGTPFISIPFLIHSRPCSAKTNSTAAPGRAGSRFWPKPLWIRCKNSPDITRWTSSASA